MQNAIINWQYKINQILFEDQISYTYYGEILNSQEPVLIWQYKKQFLSPEIVNKLLLFSQKIKAIKHPNFTPLLDAFCYNDNFYAIYPHEEGFSSLGTFIKENLNAFNENQVFIILEKVISVLEILEKNRLVYGNINLFSIFINRDKEIRITNILFPLLIIKPQIFSLNNLEDGIFSAPELLGKGEFTVKSDIYSFGVLAYYLLTGEWPYKYSENRQHLIKNFQNSFVLPQELNPEIPLYLDQIIRICLAKNPEKRFNSSDKLKLAFSEQKELNSQLSEIDQVDANELIETRKPELTKDFYANYSSDSTKMIKIGAVILGLFIVLIIGYISYVFYSKSIPDVAVPNVVGLTQEEAMVMLEESKLKGVISGELTRPRLDPGTVIETHPPAGRLVKINREIQLFIVKEGPVIVPDLVSKTFQEAELITNQEKFNLKIQNEIYSDTIGRGYIISQEPSANSEVAKNSDINVVISKGFPVEIKLKQDGLIYSNSENQATIAVSIMIPQDWKPQQITIYSIGNNKKQKLFSQKMNPGDSIYEEELIINNNDVVKVYFNNKQAVSEPIIIPKDKINQDNTEPYQQDNEEIPSADEI